MRSLEALQDPHVARGILSRIHAAARALDRPVRLMEVCGTHTVSLRRHGIHSLLPASINLVSGPGCPVCVTPSSYIDNALALARSGDAVVASFGDMLKVPGSAGESLAALLGSGRVRVVYSPAELLRLAQSSSSPVVFLGVGFETTIPAVATVFRRAAEGGARNLLLYSSFKTVPRALEALMRDPSFGIDGFLLPGHVSAIIGVGAYGAITRGPRPVPGVIAGFEPVDMLLGILELLRLLGAGTPEVLNAYPRAVRPEGNRKAREVMESLLQESSELWRGLGHIPGASLSLRSDYSAFDARVRFGIPELQVRDPPECRCAEVIQGKIEPPQCTLFARRCTPDRPVGPCMVSSEGTCAAYFRYGATR